MIMELTCVICGDVVSKRKSLAFKKGRACRTHKEVVDMLADKIKKAGMEKSKADMKKFADSMNLIMAVSWVRVNHTLNGVPFLVLINSISAEKGLEFANSVADKVNEMGGPKLSMTHLLNNMLSYNRLFNRNK